MRLGRYVLITLLATAESTAWGLSPELALTQFGHRVWTTADGLPQDSIRAIAQTTDGYLWFATTNELARFDGVRFAVFNAANVAEMKESWLTSLAFDPDGSLWIGSVTTGLRQYRPGAFRQVAANLGLTTANVVALFKDSRGTLWIGADGGLARLDQGQVKPVFTGTNVHVIRTVWVGANNGLHRSTAARSAFTPRKEGLPEDSISGLSPGTNGALWVGTHTAGLSEFRNGTFSELLGPRRFESQRDLHAPRGL
jgi:ligand-binding sensor domain-containing protein